MEALPQADLVLICVGTPSDPNGNLDLSHIRRVCEEIALHRAAGQRLVVAVRSTVFPGTCDEVVGPIVGNDVPWCAIPSSCARNAVRDFMEPSLIVIGGSAGGGRASRSGLPEAGRGNQPRIAAHCRNDQVRVQRFSRAQDRLRQ